jgi:hypothetical protein
VDAGAATGETWSVDADVMGIVDGTMVGARVLVVPGPCIAASLEVTEDSLRFGWGNLRSIDDAHRKYRKQMLGCHNIFIQRTLYCMLRNVFCSHSTCFCTFILIKYEFNKREKLVIFGYDYCVFE